MKNILVYNDGTILNGNKFIGQTLDSLINQTCSKTNNPMIDDKDWLIINEVFKEN